MFAPLVRTLFGAVVMLLVVAVNAQASLLHNQYYFDSMPASETVGQNMTTDGLALVGTFELLAEGSPGGCGSITGCAELLVFSIAQVDGAGGGQARLLFRRYRDFDLFGNGPSHFTVQGQNIFQITVEDLRP